VALSDAGPDEPPDVRAPRAVNGRTGAGGVRRTRGATRDRGLREGRRAVRQAHHLRGVGAPPAHWLEPAGVLAGRGLGSRPAIHAETSKYADLLDDWNDLQVSRLDLVRDLHGVPDVAQVLDRLAQVPSRGKTREQYNDPRRGGAQTLRVSTARRWSVTAYDKAAEQTSAAGRTSDPERRAHHRRQAVLAKGQLRTEVGLRSEVLRERQGTTRCDALLKQDVMDTLARHYFDAAGLGTPIGGLSRIGEALDAIAANPQEAKMSDRMIGILYQQGLGRPPTASANTVADHLRLARKYGITAADLVAGDGPTIRLDWDSARVVTQVAS